MGTTVDRIRWMARLAHGLCLARSGIRPVPLLASLEVTLKCDGGCAYCASPLVAGGGDLTTRDWLGIIDNLARAGTVAASLTGGEPLLRKDLALLADRCRRHGIRVELNTNGRLLPGRREVLASIDGMTISLDGVREVQDRVRGPGAFDAAMEAIDLARSSGVPVVATAVLSTDALERLDEFLELMVRLRLPVRFQPVYPVLLRSTDLATPSVPDPDSLGAGIRRLQQALAAGVPIMNSRAALEYMSRLPGGGFLRCGGGRYFVRVTSRGEMGICGLDRDPSPGGLDARTDLAGSLGRLAGASGGSCSACLSAARLEVHLALGGSASALTALVRR